MISPNEEKLTRSNNLTGQNPGKSRNLWGNAAQAFFRNKAGVAGFVIVIGLFFVAIFAPLLAPYDYAEQNYSAILKPPTAEHWMGTDELGRDILSRVIISLRTAVLVATLITLVAGTVGVLVGCVGALLGGWVDLAIVWVMDALLTIPTLLFAAFISVATRPLISSITTNLYSSTKWPVFRDTVMLDYLVVIGCLALVAWPGIGRLVRGQVLSLREKEFIEAEHSLGAPTWWIIRKHLIPNLLGTVIVALSINFGYSVLFEASLSFLGIGIRPPGASLGQMISDGIGRYRSAPYLVAMPGLVLALIVLAFNFVGDALNDALNPKARQR